MRTYIFTVGELDADEPSWSAVIKAPTIHDAQQILTDTIADRCVDGHRNVVGILVTQNVSILARLPQVVIDDLDNWEVEEDDDY